MSQTSPKTDVPAPNAPNPQLPEVSGKAEIARMLSRLLPELCIALVLAGLWGAWWPAELALAAQEGLLWVLTLEMVTLMLMVTLVDFATRLRRPLPVWWVLPLCAGLLVMYPETLSLLVGAWEAGWWVFLPLALSLGERLGALWSLPRASVAEKLRCRALAFGRLSSAVVLLCAYVAALLLLVVLAGEDFDVHAEGNTLALPFLTLFYLIAVLDAWRVHQARFLRQPRSLWPFFDAGETARLDPL